MRWLSALVLATTTHCLHVLCSYFRTIYALSNSLLHKITLRQSENSRSFNWHSLHFNSAGISQFHLFFTVVYGSSHQLFGVDKDDVATLLDLIIR